MTVINIPAFRIVLTGEDEEKYSRFILDGVDIEDFDLDKLSMYLCKIGCLDRYIHLVPRYPDNSNVDIASFSIYNCGKDGDQSIILYNNKKFNLDKTKNKKLMRMIYAYSIAHEHGHYLYKKHFDNNDEVLKIRESIPTSIKNLDAIYNLSRGEGLEYVIFSFAGAAISMTMSLLMSLIFDDKMSTYHLGLLSVILLFLFVIYNLYTMLLSYIVEEVFCDMYAITMVPGAIELIAKHYEDHYDTSDLINHLAVHPPHYIRAEYIRNKDIAFAWYPDVKKKLDYIMDEIDKMEGKQTLENCTTMFVLNEEATANLKKLIDPALIRPINEIEEL
jgi:hypothetical protein